MPLDQEAKDELKAIVDAALVPVLEQSKKAHDLATEVNANFPSMAKRYAGESLDEAKRMFEDFKAAQASLNPDDKKKDGDKDDPNEELAKRLNAMEGELKERDKRTQEAEKGQAIAEAFSEFKFASDLAKSTALQAVASQTERKEDGSFFAKVKRKLEATGAEIDEELKLRDAASRFVDGNKWLLAVNVKGGVEVNAGGSGGSGEASDGTGYKAMKLPGIMADVTALRWMMDNEPDLLKQKKAEHYAKKE